MKTFTDALKREWSITINVDAIKRVKAAVGVDLCDLYGGEPMLAERLERDSILLTDVVYELIGAKAAGVTLDQFCMSIDATTIGGLVNAFWGEFTDFFLSFRPSLAKKIDETPSPSTSGESSTNLPASSESTPAT